MFFFKVSKGAKGNGLGQGVKDALTLQLTLTIAILFVCQCQTNCLKLNSNETQVLMENSNSFDKTCIISKRPMQNWQYVVHDVRLLLQG